MGVWRGRRRVADSGGLAVPSPESRLGRRRWLAFAAVTFVLFNVLAVGAYANSRFAPDNEQVATGDDPAVPAAVREGGPVVDATNRRVV